MSRPRGQHGQSLSGLPKHYPHCTKSRRAEEGCECSIRYYLIDGPVPSARSYRATRRRCARSDRRYFAIEKRHGLPPQHNHLATWNPWPRRDECPAGCPVRGFVYERDWPPTVQSWAGLL